MRRVQLAIAVDGLNGRGGTERQIIDIAIGMRERGWSPTIVSRWPVDRTSEARDELADAAVPLITREVSGDAPWQRVVHRVTGRDVAAAMKERAAYAWQTQQFHGLAQRGELVIHEVPYFGRMPKPAVDGHLALHKPVVHTILGTPTWSIMPAAPWAVMTSDGAPIIDGDVGFTWIPCTTHHSATAAPLALDDEAIRLLFVGRLVASKGLDVLLEAIDPLPAHISLVVVGDGPERQRLEQRAARLTGRVTFLGSLPRPEVLTEIQRAHVVVVPSMSSGIELQEGMPTVVAEALSQHRPVVATAVGGMPIVVSGHKPPGWLIRPDDAESLRRVLAGLSPESVARASDEASRVYDQILAPDVVFDAYERCYDQAVRRCSSLA